MGRRWRSSSKAQPETRTAAKELSFFDRQAQLNGINRPKSPTTKCHLLADPEDKFALMAKIWGDFAD